jgi:hypothetical protein
MTAFTTAPVAFNVGVAVIPNNVNAVPESQKTACTKRETFLLHTQTWRSLSSDSSLLSLVVLRQ